MRLFDAAATVEGDTFNLSQLNAEVGSDVDPALLGEIILLVFQK